MKPDTSVTKTVRIVSWITAVIIALVPFHAFMTVWLSSLVGHYTLLRLWKEFLLVIILAGVFYVLWKDRTLLKRLFSSRLVQLISIYSLLLLLWGFVPLLRHDVTAKAMWYGVLVDLRYLVFFLAVVVLSAKSDFLARRWVKLLLAPAALVAAFAVLQYLVLPYNFLEHFGYSSSTIPPYETINNNIQHIRVESTLRGANPLGAYLIVPICALAVFFFREKVQKLNKSLLGFGLALALIFSFSRSAWIGAVLSALVIIWLSLKSARSKRIIALSLTGLAILAAILAVGLRNNIEFENVFLHTQRGTKAITSSNENHASAFKSASEDIIHQPFGRGVGTAGPQSIYNNGKGRIAENYFLQIGQEAGVIGMALFIAVCVYVGKILYDRRTDPLALALLAALIGLSFVNLLSHAWEDDTLAYMFWGLAGIACSPAILAGRHKRKNGKIKTAP